MKYPHKLLPGMTVGIVAPSSPLSPDGVAASVEGVKSLGFKVKLADNLSDNIGGYMAGSGKIRGEWINRMFADPTVDGIICLRGGDAGTRAVPYIDLDVIRQNPKPFVGFSDITTHHLIFNQSCNMISFHGPMAVNMQGGLNEYSTKSLFDCINSDKEYNMLPPEGFEYGVLQDVPSHSATGVITGGNLSLLSAAVGTSFDPDTRGKILFIEEVGESITKVEKWACHLRNAGKLGACAGILLGQFTDIESQKDYTELNVFAELMAEYKIPVMYGIQSGHDRFKSTIPMGAVCHMDTKTKEIVFEIDR